MSVSEIDTPMSVKLIPLCQLNSHPPLIKREKMRVLHLSQALLKPVSLYAKITNKQKCFLYIFKFLFSLLFLNFSLGFFFKDFVSDFYPPLVKFYPRRIICYHRRVIVLRSEQNFLKQSKDFFLSLLNYFLPLWAEI
jgi:hypothetical protein